MKIEVTKTKVLDDTDRRILDKLASGKSHKQIAADLYLKKPQVTYKIKMLKQEYKCDNIPQLIRVFYGESEV